MQDKQSKEIVDSQGNAYKSTKDSKIKQVLQDNIRCIFCLLKIYYTQLT